MVSSAYWLILHSTPFIFMPLMFLSFLTALANISAQGIKIYGERGTSLSYSSFQPKIS